MSEIKWWKMGAENLHFIQRLGTNEWTARFKGLVVQIGAHDHDNNIGRIKKNDHDPAVHAINNGWNALLIEPMPDAYQRLSKKYKTMSHIRTVQSAICSNKSCDTIRTIYSVDLTNSTGNWGTSDADSRCLDVAKSSNWLPQIASLSRDHLIYQNRNFAYTPRQCKQCSIRFGYNLPKNCLRNVVKRNIKSQNVTCNCIDTLLRGEDKISLLVIDAEGYDDIILRDFPFRKFSPWRISFEASHLSRKRYYDLTTYLWQLGYRCIWWCSPTASITTWHHLNSSE
jgi:hypothetical protein